MTDSQSHRDDSMDDLVKAAATDREAFGRLFDHFYPAVFAYCIRRLVVRAVAEDVTSEVFLKVTKAIGREQLTTTEDFRRWLFCIATNEINAQLRKSLRRRDLFAEAVRLGTIKAEVAAPLFENDTPAEWHEIYRALAKLTEREQSVIWLRYFTTLTPQQIAEVLTMKSGTFRVALNRALGKLRDLLRPADAPSPSRPETTAGGN